MFNFGILLGLIVWSVVWWRQNSGAELYAIPVFCYAVHGILFYGSFALETLGYFDISHHAWSAGFRLHGLLTLSMLAYSLSRLRRRLS